MMQRTTFLATMSIFTVLVAGTAPASGQETPPPPVEKPPAAEPEEKPVAPPPSLDDLLEIDPAPNAETGDADGDVAESDRRALDAALAEQEPAQAFRSAIEDMLVSTELLGQRQSTGLGTQRLQQRIVDRLQTLIDAAARQQQQQQQSSSSSQQQQQQQQQEPGKRSEQQQQQQEQQGDQQQQGDQRRDGSEGQSDQPPPPQGADLQGSLEGSGVEWGNLPPRMRDLVTQGLRDRVSEVYRSLTEAYYKRMAEEGDG